MKHFLIIASLSITAILTHGYQFAVSDQEIFIPYILKAADDSLFKNDLLFEQSSSFLSLFYPIYGVLNRLFDLQILFFVSFIIFQFIFFLVIYNFSKTLIKDENLAYLSLFPFLMPKFIGGTATLTYDIFFGYRSIGVVFLILFLNSLFQKKIIKSILFAALGMVFHPLSIVPNLFLPASIFFEKIRHRLSSIDKKVFIAIGFFLILIAAFFSRGIFPRNDEWHSIIKSRDDYLFLSTWGVRGWASFFMYIALILLLLKKLQLAVRKTALLFLSISLTVLIAAYFVLEIIRVPSIAQFQLTRSITPLAYIALTISPLLLVQEKLLLKLIGFVAFLSLSLNAFNLLFISITTLILAFIFQRKLDRSLKISIQFIKFTSAIVIAMALISSFSNEENIRSIIQFPKEKSDWIDLQIWAKSNTNQTDVFLVPPDQTGFRIFSQRPIIGDIKDGAVVIYDYEFAKKWFEIKQDTQNYYNLTTKDFILLQNKYDFSFIVTKLNHSLDYEKIYQNNSWAIYRMGFF